MRGGGALVVEARAGSVLQIYYPVVKAWTSGEL